MSGILERAMAKLGRDPQLPAEQTFNKIIKAYSVRIYTEFDNSYRSARQAKSGDAGMPEDELIDLIDRSIKGAISEFKQALLNDVKKAPMPEFIVNQFKFVGEPEPEPVPVVEQGDSQRTTDTAAAVDARMSEPVAALPVDAPESKLYTGNAPTHIFAMIDIKDPFAKPIVDALLSYIRNLK